MKKKEVTLYQRAKTVKESSAFHDFSSESGISEKEIKKKPTKKDIKYVKGILEDFYIEDIEIPEFSNILDLTRWMKSLIKEKLNK